MGKYISLEIVGFGEFSDNFKDYLAEVEERVEEEFKNKVVEDYTGNYIKKCKQLSVRANRLSKCDIELEEK